MPVPDAARPAGSGLRSQPQLTASLIAAAVVVAGLLAWVPWLSPLAYPFRLLLTLVHELGHGLAALVTGGQFQRLAIFTDGSGLAYTAGGWRLFVIPAGYLGAACFAGATIVLAANPRTGRWTLGILGALVGLLSLRYGLPSLFTGQALGGLLAVSSGVLLGVGLVILAVLATDTWVSFAVLLIAIQAGLEAFSDLRVLIGLSSTAERATDAHSMAELTLVPAVIWAIVWAITAAAIVVAAVRWGWSAALDRPLRES